MITTQDTQNLEGLQLEEKTYIAVNGSDTG